MNEQELLIRLNECKTNEEYDKLIDKYVFKISKTNRNTKSNRSNKHGMLSTEQMQHIQRKEISTDSNLL